MEFESHNNWNSVWENYDTRIYQRLSLSTDSFRDKISQYCTRNIPLIELEAIEHTVRNHFTSGEFLMTTPLNVFWCIQEKQKQFQARSEFTLKVRERLSKNTYHILITVLNSEEKCISVIKLQDVIIIEAGAKFLYKINFKVISWSIGNFWERIPNRTFSNMFFHTDVTDKRRNEAVKNLIKNYNYLEEGSDNNRLITKLILRQSECVSSKKPRYGKFSGTPGLSDPNQRQTDAIMHALNDKSSLTIVQGPPGTGKTETAAHMIYHMFLENKVVKKKVLYCSPSNKATDNIIGYLLKIPEENRPRIVRVLSSFLEGITYPCPKEGDPFFYQKPYITREDIDKVKRLESYTDILLHEIIRHTGKNNRDIINFDQKIACGSPVSNREIQYFYEKTKFAKKEILKKADVILCTCTTAGSNILAGQKVKQVIIDECGMCTESDCFIPLTKFKPAKVVFVGDPQQLQPIIFSRGQVRKGLQDSFYEFFSRSDEGILLDTQYRMHSSICKFPSRMYYSSSLVCGHEKQYRPSILGSFWRNRQMPKVFLNTNGREMRRFKDRSFYNAIEARHIIRILGILLYGLGIKSKDIVVLTYYRAQVDEIQSHIKRSKLIHNFSLKNVQTVVTSQGSEWKYVIVSCVRSLESKIYPVEPDTHWIRANIGFVDDYHQQNVAITRAKDGLIILGKIIVFYVIFI